MASLFFDEGAFAQIHQDKSFLADTLDVLLVDDTYTPAKGDTLATAAAKEISIGGYVPGFGGAGRKVLASKTMTLDGTLHRDVFDAADPSAWTLATGVTVGGAVLCFRGTASDATALAFAFVDVTDTPTNGGAFTLSYAAAGIGYVSR